MLIFPSRGPESLSRVLIEASALGVPIAAMNTGGTPDIVIHEQTGLLSATFEALADDVRRLRGSRTAKRHPLFIDEGLDRAGVNRTLPLRERLEMHG